MTKALIHRYDNEPDILQVEANGCSDVYLKAKDNDFSLIIVIPTGKANTTTSIVADATSGQFKPQTPKHWPGRSDGYNVRVNMDNIRYTTVDKVRAELIRVGKTWAAQWQVAVVELDEGNLF